MTSALFELETSRLWLRPFRPEDVPALHTLWTDADVRRFLERRAVAGGRDTLFFSLRT
jgi:RimJ/RimL family protein N-acetyltransferase